MCILSYFLIPGMRLDCHTRCPSWKSEVGKSFRKVSGSFAGLGQCSWCLWANWCCHYWNREQKNQVVVGWGAHWFWSSFFYIRLCAKRFTWIRSSKTSLGWNYYCPYFIAEETEASEVTYLIQGHTASSQWHNLDLSDSKLLFLIATLYHSTSWPLALMPGPILLWVFCGPHWPVAAVSDLWCLVPCCISGFLDIGTHQYKGKAAKTTGCRSLTNLEPKI